MIPLAAGHENAPETRDPIDLQIQGTIPPWLSGILYRTGPGTFRIPTTADPSKSVEIEHWFDGLTLHHRFQIFPGGQRVTYRSRRGAEELEKSVADEGALVKRTFGQRDPCKILFRKFFTEFETKTEGNAPEKTRSPNSQNVGVTITPNMPSWGAEKFGLPEVSSGPRYIVAKTDNSNLQLLDPSTLEPISLSSYADLDPRLAGPFAAAHSCRDSQTGDFYNFVSKAGSPFPTYKVFRIAGKDGKVDILATIEDAPLAYIHSVAMTAKYVVLCIWQSHMENDGSSIRDNMNTTESIKPFDPDHKSVFYVIDRHEGGVVAKYTTPPFFCFHQLNAYDDSTTGDLIVDMAIYDDNSVLNLLYLDHLRNQGTGNVLSKARRFRLPSPSSSRSTSPREAIVEFTLPQIHGIELPTVAPSFYHKPYRYTYGINKHDPSQNAFGDSIIKIDMASSSATSPVTKLWHNPGHAPSEPIFVPRPGSVDEDDGVLLTVVLDDKVMKSSMVVIDAKEMVEVARAQMPVIYPFGFHGAFYGQ